MSIFEQFISEDTAQDIKEAGPIIKDSLSKAKEFLTISPEQFSAPDTSIPLESGFQEFIDIIAEPDQQFREDNRVIPDTLEAQPSPKDQPWLAPFYAGVGDVLNSAGGTSKFIGGKIEGEDVFDKFGDFIIPRGDALTERFTDTTKLEDLDPFNWSHTLKPEFYHQVALRSVPYVLSLVPAAIAGESIIAGGAAAAGLGAFSSTVVGTLGSAGISTIIESSLEAGQSYKDAFEKFKNEGKSDLIAHQEANAIADEVFIKNLAIIVTNAPQFLTTFLPGGKFIPKSLLGKIGAVGVTESVEEILQQKIQVEAAGGDFNLGDPLTKQAGFLGLLSGILFGGFVNLMSFFRNEVISSSPEKAKEEFEKEKERLIKSGKTEQQANILSMDKVMEDNKGIIEPIINEKIAELKKIQGKPADSEAKVAFDEAQIQIAKEEGTIPQFAQELADSIVQQDNLVTPTEFLQENRQLVEQAQQASTLEEFQQIATIPEGIDQQAFFEQAKQQETVEALRSVQSKESREFRQLQPEKFKTFKAFFKENKGKDGAIISNEKRAREEFKAIKQERIAEASAPAIGRLNEILSTRLSEILFQPNIRTQDLTSIQDVVDTLGDNISSENQSALELITDEGGLAAEEIAQLTQDEVKQLGEDIETARRAELTTAPEVPKEVQTIQDIDASNLSAKQKKIQKLISSLKSLGKHELAIENFGKLSIKINAIERSVGEAQSIMFEMKERGRLMFKLFEEILGTDITSDRVGEAIFDFRDSGQPLPEDIKDQLGDTLDLVTEDQDFIASALSERDLVTDLWDAESYMRRSFVQKDGTEPTKSQILEMQLATPQNIKGDILRITTGGGGKLSTKSKFFKARKFQTADDADAFIGQFGLKVNRNFFESVIKQREEVGRILFNFDFKDSLRKQAKQEVDGIVEVFDPVKLSEFRQDLVDDMQRDIDRVIEDSKFIKDNTRELIKKAKLANKIKAEEIKMEIRLEDKNLKSLPPELRSLGKEFLNQPIVELKAQTDQLVAELNNNLKKISKNSARIIKAIRADKEAKLKQELVAIARKGAKLQDEGFVPVPDVVVANQLRGILMNKSFAESIDNIFEKLKPSSLEDAIRTYKMMVATGDLFQIKSTIEANVGAGSIDAIFDMMGFRDEVDFIKKGKPWVQAGLRTGRPSDINIKILRELGADWDNIAESKFAGFLRKISESFDEKVVAAAEEKGIKASLTGISKKFTKGIVTKAQALEELQWATIVPAAKVRAAEAMFKNHKGKFNGVTEEEIRFKIADFVNNAFQGQNWDMIMARHPSISKHTQRFMTFGIFGPDRITSIGKVFFGLMQKGIPGSLARKWAIRSLLYSTFLTQLFNYIFNGHSTFENERGNELSTELPFIKDQQGNVVAVQIGGNVFEIMKFLNRPRDFLANKQSSFMGLVMDLIAPRFGNINLHDLITDNLPLPFAAQGLGGKIFDVGKEEFGFVEDDYAVPENIWQALAAFGLEFSGFPVAFRTGKRKGADIIDFVRGSASMDEWIFGNPVKRRKKRTRVGGL